MAVPCCACFGPNDSFFLNSPSKWSMDGLPSSLYNLFTQIPKLREVHDMALGPDGSYSVIYTNASGIVRITYANLPTGLERWLVPRAGGPVSASRDLATMKISLGPNKSYFAHDKNGSGWGNLPDSLDSAIKEYRGPNGHFKRSYNPQSVSLGAGGTYVLVTDGGAGAWNLGGEADDVRKFLKDSNGLKGISVILSPTRLGINLVLFSDGRSAATLPDAIMTKYDAFAADLKQYGQALAARKRTSKTSTSRAVIQGLGLVSHLLNAASGNYSGNSGNAGFDASAFTSTNSGFDMSSFWQPISDAASAPIQ